MKLTLKRLYQTKKEILGELNLTSDRGVLLMTCNTLELPYNHNNQSISCIPTGCYEVEKYNSPSKGKVLLLKNVPNRNYIEIHSGNFYYDTEGCILVGASLNYDINRDGQIDVNRSRNTLQELLKHIKEPIWITINDYIC